MTRASAACDAGVCSAPEPLVTYDDDAQPIYADKCGTCHTGDGSGGHDIGTSYADGMLSSYLCAEGVTKAECTLELINSGYMPLSGGCGGPVADDAANSDVCITVTEYAILEAWVADGTVESN